MRENGQALAARIQGAPQSYIERQLARLDRAMMVVSQKMANSRLPAVPRLPQMLAQHDRYDGCYARRAIRENAPREGQIFAVTPC